MVNVYTQKSIRAFSKCLPVLPQTYNSSCLPLFPMLPHSDIKRILQAHQSAISLLPLTQALENFMVDFQCDDIHRLSLVVFKPGFLTFALHPVSPPMLCMFQFPNDLYISLYSIGWSLIPVGKLVIPVIRTFKSVLCSMEEQLWFGRWNDASSASFSGIEGRASEADTLCKLEVLKSLRRLYACWFWSRQRCLKLKSRTVRKFLLLWLREHLIPWCLSVFYPVLLCERCLLTLGSIGSMPSHTWLTIWTWTCCNLFVPFNIWPWHA